MTSKNSRFPTSAVLLAKCSPEHNAHVMSRHITSYSRDTERESGGKHGNGKKSRKKDRSSKSGSTNNSSSKRDGGSTNGYGGRGAGDEDGGPPLAITDARKGSVTAAASDRYKNDPFYLGRGEAGGSSKLVEDGADTGIGDGDSRGGYYDAPASSNALALVRDDRFDDDYLGDAGVHGGRDRGRKGSRKDKRGSGRAEARGSRGGGGGGAYAVDNVEVRRGMFSGRGARRGGGGDKRVVEAESRLKMFDVGTCYSGLWTGKFTCFSRPSLIDCPACALVFRRA